MEKYSETFTVRYTDVNRSNHLTLKSLVTYFQEVAGRHSQLAGYSVNDIPNTHVTWLLINWKVKMFNHPHVNEALQVSTWARDFEKCYSYRDFEVLDTNGKLIAIASSKWVLINTNTKKLANITPEIISAYGIFKTNVFENNLKFLSKLSVQNPDLTFSYDIQRRDIDTNGHVNNLHYIDYAFEALPEEVYNKYEFNNIEILYKREIKYPNKINCYYAYLNGEHIILIKSSDESILHSIVKLY